MSSPLDAVPATLRRLVGFVVGAIAVYGIIVAVVSVTFPAAIERDGVFPLTATLVAALVAYHLVYRGGYARLHGRLR